MKKMIIAAMVLLVAQIGLVLVLNIGNKGIEAGAPDTLFLTFSPDEVHSLELINSEGKNVVMEKEDTGWIVPAHFSAPVDESKVKALLHKMAEIKKGFVVATSAEAAKRFKVDAENFANHVILRGTEKPLADFYVGTSPAFRQVHARRAESDEIVTVPLSDFELDSSVDKWLDTSTAMMKDGDLIGLTFDTFKLKKADDGWQLEDLKEGEKLNLEEVNSLVTNARSLVIMDVLDPGEVAHLFDQPVFRFTAVKKGGQEVDYLFAKGKGDFYVLRLSDRNLYFKVHTLPVESLQKVTREKMLQGNTTSEDSSQKEDTK